MRIGAIAHMYPPRHNAGAEWMLHIILRWLAKERDASCSVWVPDLNQHRHDSFQGVPITGRQEHTPAEYAAQQDVVLTHLDMTQEAMMACKRSEKPLAHLVHNDRQLAYNGVTPSTGQLVVFNSKWLCARVGWPGKQIIVPPPVPPADYRTDPGCERGLVTLVNVSAEKGAEAFYQVARRCPERRFCGVLGAYNGQIREEHPNVALLPQTPRIRSVYAATRVLLMPSIYESYGRVAIEAGWSGIPTIYHPTPGLLESVGMAGLIADRMHTEAWVEALALLDDPECYEERSSAALANSKAAWATAQSALSQLSIRLEDVASAYQQT